VDVDTNPRNTAIGDRAFGDDPELVGRLGTAMIAGLQEGGVAACAKHFPGHGDTDVDSHLSLPAVDHSRARLEDVELRPFRRAIEAGVAMIMSAHVLVRELDDRLPSTLSPRLLEELLRKEMKAVAEWSGSGKAAGLAAKAGCDLVIVSKTPDAQVAAIEELVRSAEAEEVSWEAVDTAAERVRRLKERFLLPYKDPDPKQARLSAGVGEHRRLAEQIAAQAGIPG
ncbi:MAG: beta-N-acetylhexosaminidase, partial [Acidobacteria bacterium]